LELNGITLKEEAQLIGYLAEEELEKWKEQRVGRMGRWCITAGRARRLSGAGSESVRAAN
jgi:hypothetical protein